MWRWSWRDSWASKKIRSERIKEKDTQVLRETINEIEALKFKALQNRLNDIVILQDNAKIAGDLGITENNLNIQLKELINYSTNLYSEQNIKFSNSLVLKDVSIFLKERFKNLLKDKKIRNDIIEAAGASHNSDDFLALYKISCRGLRQWEWQIYGDQNRTSLRYSERKHTIASRKYPDDVPEHVKSDRVTRLAALQKNISTKVKS